MAFPPLAAEQALHYLSQLIEGYREGMSAPLLVLPESGGAWLKTCYDAQNDAMLDDDSTLQKARTKFLQAYEGNMMVRGEGDDIWYQRLWRQLTPETMEAIVEQSQRFLFTAVFALISHECCIKKFAQIYPLYFYDAHQSRTDGYIDIG